MGTASIRDASTAQTSPQSATVSVVVPAYNAAEFLGEALESVLAQTYPPLEVIVVDDGSEDETPQVVSAFNGKVTYMRKERGGPASARNAGIRAAKGDWIAFQDADDIWMPGLLEKLVEASGETGADLVFCDALTLKNGSVVGPTFFESAGLKARLRTLAPNRILLDPLLLFLEFHQFMLTDALLVRREALLQVGLFDEAIYCGEDLDLWLRLSVRSAFAVVDETLVLRRLHTQNVTRDAWTVRAGLLQVYEKFERNAPSSGPSMQWRKVLRKKKAPMLREQGARYLESGDLLSARQSWAKSFRASHSPTMAAYWLLSFLPQPWVQALRDWKARVRSVPRLHGVSGRQMADGLSKPVTEARTMNSEKPAVSVIIPAYNAAEFLGEALDSVLAQTYQPIEVFVVDDGSVDTTPQVVAAYAGKITYIRKPHGGGCGGTRNVGIRAASGEWVAFLDADNVWMPDFLKKLVRGGAETGADLVFCDYLKLIDGNVAGPTNLEQKGFKTQLDTLAPNGILLNPFELLLEVGCYIDASSVMVRRNALLEIGLFDEGIYCTDDLDLWLRLSLRYRFTPVNEALMLYRWHAGNMSRDRWTLMVNQIKTYEKVERYAPALAHGRKWRKILRKKKAPLLREEGSVYLESGERLSARESWAKSFRSSYSPRLAAYWLSTFLPDSWTDVLRRWKRRIEPPPLRREVHT